MSIIWRRKELLMELYITHGDREFIDGNMLGKGLWVNGLVSEHKNRKITTYKLTPKALELIKNG